MKHTLLMILTLLSLTAHADLETVDCTSAQRTDLEAMADYVSDNWTSFENYIDDNYGISLGSCLKNRFQDNGKIVCEKSCDSGVNGWASYLNKRAHFCPSFLSKVGAMSTINRRACYFALAAHEFGHTCDRGHGTVEDIDNGAFDWYDLKHINVTIDLINCGMD